MRKLSVSIISLNYSRSVTCVSKYSSVTSITILYYFAGSQTMSTDDPPTTPTAIESTNAITDDTAMATVIKTTAITAAMATAIEPHAIPPLFPGEQ